MARTHNASANRFHQDDGVVLGKGGEPIPTNPTRGISTLTPHGVPLQHMDDGEIVAPPPKPEPVTLTETVFACDRTTWQRNMDGFQALHLVNAMMKQMTGFELAATLTETEMRELPLDVRWHFKKRTRPIEAKESE